MTTFNLNSPGTLPAYWDASATLPFQQVEIPSPLHSPTRWLSPTERATVKISAPTPDEVRPGFSILHEAAVRLSTFQTRGILPYASGHWVADALQRVFWSSHPGRHARRGWSLLAVLDESELGVEIWISGETLDPAGPFRRMRLRARIAELETAPFRRPR
ncbi:hypothetical protein [Microterricola pindariensis]|uniref:hypothetical protein n=1 Tax=Microterricola pindariensis TaxID=478010 RepID=UPI001056FE45|nr:hypothetical protein [Microterricola pindariensis]